MRTLYFYQGKRIDIALPQTIGDVTYPNILSNWHELGVTTEQREDYPDPTWNSWTEDADGYLTVTPKTLAQCKQIRFNQIAAERYNRRCAGLLVGGAKIKTDPESCADLNNAYVSLKFGLLQSTPWKAENGWVPLTFVDIEPVAQAVAVYVSDCFTWEKTQSELVDAMQTVEEVIAYEVPRLPVEPSNSV